MHEWLFFHAAFWFSAPLYTAFRFKKRKYMRAVFPTGEICVARALPIIIIIIFSLFSLFFFSLLVLASPVLVHGISLVIDAQ
jgi:hypothetical protein